MIKKEELRLGNYVCVSASGVIFKVESIGNSGLGVSNGSGKTWMEFKWFEAIPLTKHWIDKFSDENGEIYCFGGEIMYLEDGYYLIDSDGRTVLKGSIKYLHQLQNLYFALDQTELEKN